MDALYQTGIAGVLGCQCILYGAGRDSGCALRPNWAGSRIQEAANRLFRVVQRTKLRGRYQTNGVCGSIVNIIQLISVPCGFVVGANYASTHVGVINRP